MKTLRTGMCRHSEHPNAGFLLKLAQGQDPFISCRRALMTKPLGRGNGLLQALDRLENRMVVGACPPAQTAIAPAQNR